MQPPKSHPSLYFLLSTFSSLLLCISASLCSSPAFAEVKRIQIPKYQPDLPDAEGREEFASSCLSCHTTAYITMQPSMSPAKWKESVTKMQKTFGAPFPDDHIDPIVRYITAVKENPGPRLRELPSLPPGNYEPAPLSKDKAQRAQDIQKGETLFATLCASCHGADGTGNGPAGLTLLPRPQDLTAVTFADDHIAHVVANGMPGTAMLPFGISLPKDDLRALASYAASLSKDTDPVTTQPTTEAKALYLQNCASCHGPDGRGDGIAASTLPRPAANFHHKRPSLDYADAVITDGIPGTAMTGWKTKLSDPQRRSLAEYVRTFFTPTPPE